MSMRSQLLLLVLLPVAVFAALAATKTRIPVPEIGRGYVMRVTLPQAKRFDLPIVEGDDDTDRPLVVIDAGHGGFDPGATSQGFREKDLVLGLAKALRDRLLADGAVRVAMTRSDDSYLLHTERYEIARRLGADLFLSIHADSAGSASDVAGASIYTLSNAASSQAAARFAERENQSGSVNGLELDQTSDAVNSILVELSQRRTQEESDEMARLIEREGKGVLHFHPQPRRSASLMVLRAPDVPSVLFESGYITNEAEAERLSSPEGRKRFAQVLARAIRIFFARQRAGISPSSPVATP